MSIAVQSAVWSYSKLKGTALLLLLAIADYADDRGLAFPSIRTLAKKCRMESRNINYLLVQLKKAEELEVHEGKGPRGTNLYRVKAAAGVQATAGVQKSAVPLQDSSGGGAILGKNPLHPAAPKPSIDPPLPIKEPSGARPPKNKNNGQCRKEPHTHHCPNYCGKDEHHWQHDDWMCDESFERICPSGLAEREAKQ